MPRKGIFSEEEETWIKSQSQTREAMNIRQKYKFWRNTWKKEGPINFAEKFLKIDPSTGKSLILSDDQKKWLTDVVYNNVKLSIISAGRGSGKTFVLAVYITWRIYTHEFYHISCMGGSAEQSDKIQEFIRGWIRNNNDLRSFTHKNVRRVVKSFASSSAEFKSCSATSVRGPHVKDIIVDEEAAGEERGGTKNIKAAVWEVSTAEDLRIIKSSTPHLTFGDFLETWNEWKDKGFSRYQWALAKHSSGEKNPYKIYEDMNPNHWLSNVPWSPDDAIQTLRRQKSNDEWLVEALGAISIGSGLVFKPTDLESCICKECEVCRPYYEGKCALVQYYLQLTGMKPEDIPKSTRKAVQYIGERIEGIDWGQGVSPDDYSVTGRIHPDDNTDHIFVLDFIELFGQTDTEKLDKAVEMATKGFVEIIRPDPEQSPYNNVLRDKGYTIEDLFSFEGGQEKISYLATLKKYVERHDIHIPKAYSALIRSLKNLTFNDKGKVRKVDDHAFDSLIYAVSKYGEESNAPVLSKKETEESGGKMWEGHPQPSMPMSKEPNPNPENKGETKEDDFNPFDEEYLGRRKRERGDETGAVIW